jgi:integrase
MTIKKNTGKRGASYTVTLMRNGNRIKKTFPKLRQAQDFERQVLTDDDLQQGLGNSLLNNTKFSEAVKLYLNGYTGRNLSTVTQQLDWWSARFGNKMVGRVKKIDVYNGLDALEALGRAPATRNRYKAALAGVYNHFCKVHREHEISFNPTKGVDHEEEDNARNCHLSPDEMKRLFAAAKASKWDKLYLLILAAITTGARRGELIGLKWRDIDFQRRTASLARTKNGNPRVLVLTPDLVKELMKFRGIGEAWVFEHISKLGEPFTCFEKYWYAARSEAQLENFRFHDLRHTCASLLAMNGASVVEIADILGHKSLEMTNRYSHLCTDHKSKLTDRIFGGICH